MLAMTDRSSAKLKDPVDYLRGTAENLEIACSGEDHEFGEIPLEVTEAADIVTNLRECAEHIERLQGQVAALQEYHRAIGQHLLATHKPGEVDHEAVAILDGYHVGAREVAGGGQGEPGETTLQAALRLLKLAHARGAFAAAEHVVTPATAPTGPTFRVALIDSVETIPDWVDPEAFKDAGFEDGYRACIAIFNAGKISYRWDGGEPEDNLYLRDWAWVAPALANAYEAGFDDARSGAVPTTWAEICDKIKALGLRCYIRGGEGVETALMIDGPAPTASEPQQEHRHLR